MRNRNAQIVLVSLVLCWSLVVDKEGIIAMSRLDDLLEERFAVNVFHARLSLPAKSSFYGRFNLQPHLALNPGQSLRRIKCAERWYARG